MGSVLVSPKLSEQDLTDAIEAVAAMTNLYRENGVVAMLAAVQLRSGRTANITWNPGSEEHELTEVEV